MPLPRTWAHIRRLARLSQEEERCLQLRCLGRSHAEIALALGIDSARVCAHVARGQAKCARSRPWYRRPAPWEVDQAEVAAYWAQARALEAAGRLDDLEAFFPCLRDVDDDLLQDARIILGALGNHLMRRGAPSSGPRAPGPWRQVTPDVLVSWWLEFLTGGSEDAPRRPVTEWVVGRLNSCGRKREHAKS